MMRHRSCSPARIELVSAHTCLLFAACVLFAACSGGVSQVGGAGEAAQCAARATAPRRQAGSEAGMLLVPAGPFWQGCNAALEAAQCQDNELPGRCVTVSAFEIDELELTQREYQRCVDASACTLPDLSRNAYFPDELPQLPVIMLTWEQAKSYCEWRGKRLPTEAEWEKAARGVDGRVYPWGNEAPTCSIVNYVGCGGPLPVASKSGDSPYGLKDMGGNVFEWVEDTYGYYDGLAARDPLRMVAGDVHVIRGGSWLSPPLALRAAFRLGEVSPLEVGVGFRCARTAAAQ